MFKLDMFTGKPVFWLGKPVFWLALAIGRLNSTSYVSFFWQWKHVISFTFLEKRKQE
jgi:hypothetical protein